MAYVSKSRPVRERIIATELMKLERRRAKGAAKPEPKPHRPPGRR